MDGSGWKQSASSTSTSFKNSPLKCSSWRVSQEIADCRYYLAPMKNLLIVIYYQPTNQPTSHTKFSKGVGAI